MVSLFLSVVRRLAWLIFVMAGGSPKPASAPINKVALKTEADEMRKAAWNMEKWAIGMAVLIGLLFISAACVFVFAGNLTKKDQHYLVTADGNQLVTEKGDAIVVNDSDPKKEAADFDAQRQGLIFTSITRFGTLILVFYGISILFNVFRYLIRGGNYYRARAHALLIVAELGNKDADRYAVLAEAISIEKISFGKEPSTPVALLAEALAAAKKKSE